MTTPKLLSDAELDRRLSTLESSQYKPGRHFALLHVRSHIRAQAAEIARLLEHNKRVAAESLAIAAREHTRSIVQRFDDLNDAYDIVAMQEEIERLRADGDLYREIRRLAIHYEEVQLACSTTESGWSWSVEVPPYHDPIGQGPSCEDAIDNARANTEGR